jgi:hypothetical protein
MENRDLGVRRKIDVFVQGNEHVRLTEDQKSSVPKSSVPIARFARRRYRDRETSGPLSGGT